MTASLDETLRAAVQAILRDELPEALRAALGRVLPELALLGLPNAGSPSGGATPAEALLTVREVAEELRVTDPTVRDWIKAGELPARRLGGRGQKRLLRIARAALDEFKRQRFTDGDGLPGSVEEQADDILNTVRAKAAGR